MLSSMQSCTQSLTPRRYNPRRVLADSRSRLQPSLSLALILKFLTPSLSASLITPSIRLSFDLPIRLLPSGLSKVIFLHGRLSCIRTIYPAHLSLVILIVVTKAVMYSVRNLTEGNLEYFSCQTWDRWLQEVYRNRRRNIWIERTKADLRRNGGVAAMSYKQEC